MPNATSTMIVIADAASGVDVKINGMPPSDPVPLNASETDTYITLEDAATCGKTE